MYWIDATNSSRNRLQTGVQRVTRSIFRHFSRDEEVRPLTWSPAFESYCGLRRDQLRNLTDPFQGTAAADRRPDLLRSASLGARFFGKLHQRFHRVDLAAQSGFLLVPELFTDRRIAYFQRTLPRPHGATWAVFHDALPWSLGGFAPADAPTDFEAYMAILARFDGVVCVSRESEADLHRFWELRGLVPTRTHVLPWPMPLEGRRPVPMPGTSRTVLMVATLEPRKNHFRFLEAASALWARGIDFNIRLIGRSIGEGSEPVERMIAKLQAEGRPVEWLTHVDDAALAAAYGESLFTVYPSIREGFGLPILESLWSGRPCLCGRNGALGEAAEGGGVRFMDQTDSASIAAAMAALLTDSGEQSRLFAEVKNRSFRSWPTYMAELKEILSGPASPH